MIENNIRKTLSLQELSKNSVHENPFVQFTKWMNDAVAAEITDVNAMALATADKNNVPAVRMVLLKGFDERGFVFFTNYESKKSQDLGENHKASLLFFWKELERQVRVTGAVKRTSIKESGDYFNTRLYESRLGAWASKQSSIITGRDVLVSKFEEYKAMYPDKTVPLPPFWGGFRVIPERIEFWQGRESRLHDRICYIKDEDVWEIVRLAP